MENERTLTAGKVNTPKSWKICILNLMVQPVESKTDYFLFKLVDPKGGLGPSVAWDFIR